MLSLEDFKNELGDEGKDLTEEEIVKLKDNMEQMAQLCFECWIEDKKKGQ